MRKQLVNEKVKSELDGPTYGLMELLTDRYGDVITAIIFNGKLGGIRVLTRQLGFTRPTSINFSLGIVRDIFAPIIFRGVYY